MADEKEHEEAHEEEKKVEKADKADKAAASDEEARKKDAPAEEDDDDDEEDEDDDEEDEDDEEEEPKKAAADAKPSDAKPVAAAKPVVAAKAAAKPGASPARPGARPGARPRVVGKKPATPMKKSGGGSLGKSMILFIVIVAGLGAGFYFLGRNADEGGPKNVSWKDGQTVDVELTLVKTDATDLACASPDEVAGKHCAFEAENKPWSKGSNTDDSKVLRPYTTTDRIQFVAAGLWSQPQMALDKLPPVRFNAKCKLKVDGKMKKVGVRWSASENKWYQNENWYVGTLEGCKVNP